MTDRDIMQQALDALQAYGAHAPNCEHLMLLTSLPPQRKPCSCGLVAAITALRERLAQPEQEPGTLRIDRLNQWLDASLKDRKPAREQPAQREPLKLREIEKCIYDANNDPIVACRNVEAAHGIKENT